MSNVTISKKPELITIPAYQLRKGTIIVEQRKYDVRLLTVEKVEFSHDSCRGIHVNDKWCYEQKAEVTVVK